MKKKGFRFRVLYGIILINTVFVIISGATILSSMWINSERNARELAGALIEEIQNTVANQTIVYFNSAKDANQDIVFMLYRYFTEPFNNIDNKDLLFEYYEEIMNKYLQFKMVYNADTAGSMMMLFRMNDGSFSKRLVHNTGTLIYTNWEHTNSANYGSYPNTIDPADTGYDPRKRGWYQLAGRERTPVWTSVYLFSTDNLPGYTHAIPLFDAEGNVTGVSSIDIAVEELSRFLGTMNPTPGTKIFILDKQNNLVALQAKTEADLDKLFVEVTDEQANTRYNNVASVSAIEDNEIRFLLQKTLESDEKSSLIEYENEKYISVLTPIAIGDGLDLIISIIVPENDIIGNVRKNLQRVTLISVFILISVIFISAFFSQAIAKPMRTLSNEMAKIKSFDLDSIVSISTNLSEIIDMRDSFENMRSGLKHFKRYVPADLVAQLINESFSADLGGEKQELTMFFSDIADFTSIAESLAPETLVENLCVYFETISKTIIENKGTIDKYIGDSVMAFWGAPMQIENHAEKACRSAILVRNNLQSLFRQWENQGRPIFSTRIGIHTGNVIVGNMGYIDRLNYTVIGDSVNITSRLEGINKLYKTDIIVSEFTQEQCKDDFEFRFLDKITVKGRDQWIKIYELISFKNDISKSLKQLFQYYEKGMACYFEQNWNEGLKYFNHILKYKPNDNPSIIMRDRCLMYQKNPPPADWNGVFERRTK